ncbi:hypothetical protein [Streptomyces sp. NBC_01294]|uniref:hypothetical protein n=1 Tax=Streptomyces sp. NBC_01294 TaxID=2903815 RepID=UPI002DDA6FAA|nr:hypothetical protein [Streptomyces sp. NBC_01294]WRZ59609.1 hypothetical protein OG534_25865 [Streptomyces sp. NBC_01294]
MQSDGPQDRHHPGERRPGPDTLFLAPGCTYNLTAADNPGNGLPVVTSDITIVGSFLGTQNVIRRQSATAFRIFSVQGPNARLTLNRLTVRDGRSDSSGGGGILNSGGALTLTSVEVTSNLADASGPGGGVCSSGALTIRNSTVSFNRSTNNGGGLFSFGTATISNVTVTGNTAKDSGGGMDVRGSLTLTNSRVTENSSDDAGGILSNTLNIRNSSVTYNYASEAPGGILNDGGTVTLTATPVQENFPTNCTPSVIAGCTG